MGNQDELGAACQIAQVACEAVDVDLIQRRLDLIHHAERSGTDLHDRKVQRDGDQRLLAAGERLQMHHDLTGRVDDDVNAGGEDVLGVGQLQMTLAAAEQLLEGHGEVAVDLAEGVDKDLLHLLGEIHDQVLDLLLGLLDVVDLGLHEGIAFADLLILLDRAGVDGAERLDLVLEG